MSFVDECSFGATSFNVGAAKEKCFYAIRKQTQREISKKRRFVRNNNLVIRNSTVIEPVDERIFLGYEEIVCFFFFKRYWAMLQKLGTSINFGSLSVVKIRQCVHISRSWVKVYLHV